MITKRYFFLLTLLYTQFSFIIYADLPITSGTTKVHLKLKGHVNRAMMFANNGFTHRLLHVDNDNSSTRFGAYATADVTCDVSMGATMVLELQSNKSEEIDIYDNVRGVNFTQRVTEVFIDSKCFGKLSLGYGPTFSDTTSENDLSGTDVIGLGASIDSFSGGLRFREHKTTPGPQIIEVHNGMDGLSKDNRIRYDTPEYCGWSMGASHITQDSGDVGINFNGEVNSTKIQSSAVLLRKAGDFSQTSGSTAFLFKNGVSVSFAGGRRFNLKESHRNPFMVHGKLGFTFNMTCFGDTHIAADYGRGHHFIQKEDRAWAMGLFFVQDINPACSEIYIGFRTHRLDRPGAHFRSIHASMIGARVRF